MGASFGGYSALQSSIIAPDLFQCAVAVSGVYDLALFIDDEETEESLKIARRIGSENVQQLHSPTNSIHLLKSPVLLVHGTKDDRTPLEQAEVLIEQLEKYKKTYEWFEMKNEGHNFYKTENRVLYYEKVINFLNKHNPITL
jgi:dipeptidyl aminopeptidase/acylaminoacyl peptidase